MWKLLLGGLAATALVLVGPRLYTLLRYDPQIKSVEEAPRARVAIVFGAGLRRDGRPSPVLYDRVATAVELYQRGQVEKLLMSGDNRAANYNEPAAMRQAALELGVPADDIVLDSAGQRTYDTCYRARAIFGVQEALLVTQAFHLPRALFLCEALGVRVTGVAADRRTYLSRSLTFWSARELLATAAAWWDIHIARPRPILGDPVPIE